MDELSRLYKIASMGDKPPEALATVLGNSLFGCFAYASYGGLVGAGRAPADGLDCAYIADVAVHRTTRAAASAPRSCAGCSRRLLAQTSQYKKTSQYKRTSQYKADQPVQEGLPPTPSLAPRPSTASSASCP
jgi:hypothetical protein